MKLCIAGLCLATVLLSAGCAHDGYLHDRLRDARDVATCSFGAGLGARAQLGPVNVSPAIAQADFLGLRGGEWFLVTDFGEEDEVIPTDVGFAYWGSSIYVLNDCPRLAERGKAYAAYPWGAAEEAQFSRANTDTIPFVTLPRTRADPVQLFARSRLVQRTGRRGREETAG